jgi:hypothetical protein
MRVRNGRLWNVSEIQTTERTLDRDTRDQSAAPESPPTRLDYPVYTFHKSVGQIFTIGQVEKLLNLPGPGEQHR